MSLSKRLLWGFVILLTAIALLAGTSVWGLVSMGRNVEASLSQYHLLRQVYRVGIQASAARQSLLADPQDLRPAWRHTVSASIAMDRLNPLTQPPGQLLTAITQARQSLRRAADQLTADPASPGVVKKSLGALDQALNAVAAIASSTRHQINHIQQAAAKRQRDTVIAVLLVAALMLILAFTVAIVEYRAVMRPLQNLARAVNQIAAGRFDQRIDTPHDREFASLAEDFNHMAGELETLYADLEAKVRRASAELAQSERLASVGFLAAGVAHEINNPLAIIAAEAELAQTEEADNAAAQSLNVIREEAFRCKAITDKLMSLTQPGAIQSETVDLTAIASEVAQWVRTLHQAEQRTLTIDAPAKVFALGDRLCIRQILANLLINALEAVEPHRGEVKLIVASDAGQPAVIVEDNGQGIAPGELDRVFEPFYTTKQNHQTQSGAGLGLSISHAIARQLGGQLHAQSPGKNQGSRFTLTLKSAQASAEQTTPKRHADH